MAPKPLLALLKQRLSSCLMTGTSITESGLTISTNRLSDEIIYFYRVDSEEGRRDLDMVDAKVCDCLILYIKEIEPDETLCFLELKGARLDDAKEQIISTHRKLKQMVETEYIQQNIILKACVCMRQQAPSGSMRHEAELKRVFGKDNVHLKYGLNKHYTKLGDDFLRKRNK